MSLLRSLSLKEMVSIVIVLVSMELVVGSISGGLGDIAEELRV